MSWVRIHDGAMGHLKIVSLSDSAFRLWVRGLSYCQTNLTDGLIPSAAVKDMATRRKDLDALTTSVLPGRAPLWEPVEGFGFKVHDYLDWNDPREVVVKRQHKAKDRKAKWLAEQEAKQRAKKNAARNGVRNGVLDGVPNDVLDGVRNG